MKPSNPNSSVFDRMSATTVLTAQQAAVIKQTYALFGLAVLAASRLKQGFRRRALFGITARRLTHRNNIVLTPHLA